jgi:hypothetical protein
MQTIRKRFSFMSSRRNSRKDSATSDSEGAKLAVSTTRKKSSPPAISLPRAPLRSNSAATTDSTFVGGLITDSPGGLDNVIFPIPSPDLPPTDGIVQQVTGVWNSLNVRTRGGRRTGDRSGARQTIAVLVQTLDAVAELHPVLKVSFPLSLPACWLTLYLPHQLPVGAFKIVYAMYDSRMENDAKVAKLHEEMMDMIRVLCQ